MRPGEVLAAEFIAPHGLTPSGVAAAIGVTPADLEEVIAGQGAVTAELALRLARFFGTSERFWLNLQTHFDLEAARCDLGSALDGIVPLGR